MAIFSSADPVAFHFQRCEHIASRLSCATFSKSKFEIPSAGIVIVALQEGCTWPDFAVCIEYFKFPQASAFPFFSTPNRVIVK